MTHHSLLIVESELLQDLYHKSRLLVRRPHEDQYTEVRSAGDSSLTVDSRV